MNIIGTRNMCGQNKTCIFKHQLFMTAILPPTVIYRIIIVSLILLSPLMFLAVLNQISSLMLLPLQSAYGQTVPNGPGCSCILDYTGSGHFNKNITGLTIPKLILLKNQTLQGETGAGHSFSIKIRSTQLMGILAKNFFLGNFSGGAGSAVSLNTINVKPNEPLGLQIYGGKIPKPTIVKGEIAKANVNVNGTLGDVKVLGNKTAKFQLLYTKAIKKPIIGINRFLVNVKEPGYYLLLISLSYNMKSINYNKTTNNTNANFREQTGYLIPMYETLLKIG